MRILGLDIAHRTGYALGTLGGVELSGSKEFGRTGDDLGALGAAYRGWLQGLLQARQPNLVVYEKPIPPQKHDQNVWLRKIGGLGMLTELCARDLGIRVEEADVGDVRRHFLGSGYERGRDAEKAAVMRACRVRGWRPENDDEGDALAILDYALACEKGSHHALRATPMFQNFKPLDATKKDAERLFRKAAT